MVISIELQRRVLQISVFVLGWVPVLAGLQGVLGGLPVSVSKGDGLSTDSHYRYLSGLLLALGLGFWSAIPAIERRRALFTVLTLIVFTGGLSRLLGVLILGWPAPAMVFGLAMELIVTPLLCVWQWQVSNKVPQ